MRVFLSWSGERSKKVAELLSSWFQCVIQAVDPWMSNKDIDRGALWFSEINDQLASISVGVVCLTKENKNKPWILFESGALAKGLNSNRVCTFLIGLEPTDLENPLAQFNHTSPTKDGLWRLVTTINSSLKENKVKEPVLDKVFETYWPQFEKDYGDILATTSETAIPETRQENDIMLDILSTVRGLEKRLRNMEAINDFKEVPKQPIAYSKNSLKHMIAELSGKGLSPFDIVEKLTQMGFNPGYIAEAFPEAMVWPNS